MVEYYTRMIEDINVGIEEIRQYLVDMLDLVESLRKELYAIKDQVQEDLDKTEDAYEEAGYTNAGLERVQEILDGVEEEIEEVEEGIKNEIEKIDCSQPEPGCDYSTECDYHTCDDGSCDDAPVCQHNEEPFSEEDCVYCTYTGGSDPEYGCGETESCNVCVHGDCEVNIDTGEEGNNPGSGCKHSCEYSYCNHKSDTGETCAVSTENGTTQCVYEGSIPENCTFSCTHSSSCGNQSITDCSYTCDDDVCAQGCNHEMCSQCDYSSSYCGEEESTCDEYPCTLPSDCDYDPNGDCNYDENTGIDYDCFQTEEEKCGNCSEDCGECGECSHYDCGESDTCFYSEECDETWGGCTYDCNESCGDDCSYYSCDESDECFYSDECDETW